MDDARVSRSIGVLTAFPGRTFSQDLADTLSQYQYRLATPRRRGIFRSCSRDPPRAPSCRHARLNGRASERRYLSGTPAAAAHPFDSDNACIAATSGGQAPTNSTSKPTTADFLPCTCPAGAGGSLHAPVGCRELQRAARDAAPTRWLLPHFRPQRDCCIGDDVQLPPAAQDSAQDGLRQFTPAAANAATHDEAPVTTMEICLSLRTAQS